MTRVNESLYKNVRAIYIENDILSVSMLPDHGAKIVSIYFKPQAKELLWQNINDVYCISSYDSSFLHGELSGFDDMFPTISACIYDEYPWWGTNIPDHGEVWALPWSTVMDKHTIGCKVFGVRFPYVLSKDLKLNSNKLEIYYKLQNLSPFNFYYIWAAHPLFKGEPGLTFHVPADMKRVINAVDSESLGCYGKEYAFPEIDISENLSFRLNEMRSPEMNSFHKYWFAEQCSKGWCALQYNESKLRVIIQFPEKQVPYLGLFVNEGGLEGQYNIAPEPATGAMDRIDVSKLWDMSSKIEGNANLEWHIKISVSEN